MFWHNFFPGSTTSFSLKKRYNNVPNQKEFDAIQRVIDSDMFSMGPEVAQYEKDFADFFGSKYAVMVSSGSTANLIMIASFNWIGRNKMWPSSFWWNGQQVYIDWQKKQAMPSQFWQWSNHNDHLKSSNPSQISTKPSVKWEMITIAEKRWKTPLCLQLPLAYFQKDDIPVMCWPQQGS